MKKSLRLIALTGILALSVPVVLGITSNAKKVDAYTPSSLPTTIDLNDNSAANIRSYYSGLNDKSQSERQGTNLLKNLKPILKQNQKYLSYDSGNSIWDVYCIVDRDWVKSPATSLPAAAGTYNSSTNMITNYKWGNNTSTYENPYLHILYFNRDKETVARAYGDHGNSVKNPTGINREHIWPKGAGFDTNGSGGARGDIMHLWAAHGHTNNKHSNYYYGYVDTTRTYKDEVTDTVECAGNLLGYSKTFGGTTNVFEPQDCDKGDIARACFYMVARYNNLAGDDNNIDSNNPNLELVNNITSFQSNGYTSSSASTGKLGILQDLLEWNRMDPPDEFEIHRNNLCYNNFTSNRNPFIDFPEWAEYIWGTSTNGSYSSTPTGSASPTTDTINDFSGGGTTVSVTGVSLNKNSTSVSVGGEETLAATIAPSNATNKTVTWTSSNTNVATVTSGLITGVSEGSTTITVTTQDGGFTASCAVTVTASPTPGPGTNVDDILFAKGFGGYTDGSYSAAGTDYTGVANSTNVSGSSYAMQVFNGSTGAIRGNKSGAANFSLRNTTTYSNYYISKIELDVTGTNTYSLGNSNGRSLVYFGSSAYANPNNTVPSGTGTTGTLTNSNHTLTWTNADTSCNYFILYNLETSNTCLSESASSAFTITWSPVSASTKTLTSISLDTSDAQTTFNVAETFNYNDLVVTANYDDGSSDIVTPTDVPSPDMSTTGQKTVTVTYTENGVTKTATYTITVIAVTLQSIEVSDPKTSYYVGDEFVKPTVIATYSNGSTTDVTESATFTGYDLSTAGNQTVTVSYTNVLTQTTSYNITVTAVTVTSIDVANPKTLFSVGDTFSFGGTVTAHYNNGSSADVTASASFSGYNMSTAGNQTVTVSYGGQSTTYQITVTSGTVATVIIQDYASAHSWSNGTKYTTVDVDQIITATASGGSNDGRYYTSGYEWRFYQTSSGSLTISCEDGYTIDTITITYVIANTGIFKDSSNNDVESGVSQTINATSATFTVGNTGSATNGQAKVTAITVTYHSSASPMTGITATVSKSYKVGETISASDLTVKGDNGQTVTGFSFANDGYQFTYADAASGGTSTSKTFTNSVTYQTFTCSLTVSVSRDSYVAPETSTLVHMPEEFSDAGADYHYAVQTGLEVDGVTFTLTGYIYYTTKMSFNDSQTSAPGSLINTTPYSDGITNVSVSGATVDIQLSTNGSTWVDLSDATPSTTNYYYLKLFKKNTSVSDYINITEIDVTLKGHETAKNVSNYIMYEDTVGQCTTKFTIASGYFNNMSVSEKATFMTSNDYVISTARERFEAWARSLGKTISYTDGDYVIQNARSMQIIDNSTDNQAMIIVIISVVMGGIAIGGYFFIRKKKYQ